MMSSDTSGPLGGLARGQPVGVHEQVRLDLGDPAPPLLLRRVRVGGRPAGDEAGHVLDPLQHRGARPVRVPQRGADDQPVAIGDRAVGPVDGVPLDRHRLGLPGVPDPRHRLLDGRPAALRRRERAEPERPALIGSYLLTMSRPGVRA